jgi:hypothetical protein
MSKVKLAGKFGLHGKGETIEVNDVLKKHLEAKGLIEVPKAKKSTKS